jgi:AraC family transcriptional regulator
MEARIEILAEKMLVGKRMKMTFSDNKTTDLWRGFMPRLKEVKNKIGTGLFSMQIYPHLFFDNFSPDAEFEKWAVVEVKAFDAIPDGMETFTLPGGNYAVFLYKGAASAASNTFQYIFGTWLPNSEYTLDNRPHFEILGEKYKNESPDSEEEIWIPIRLKSVGYSIAPWLTVGDSKKAVSFYKSAFGAIEVYRLEGPDGDLVARLSVNGAEFWISNDSSLGPDSDSLGGGTIRMILTAPDPDTLFIQALKAGASQVFPLGEEHGWRLGRLVDPFGLHWEIGRQLGQKI